MGNGIELWTGNGREMGNGTKFWIGNRRKWETIGYKKHNFSTGKTREYRHKKDAIRYDMEECDLGNI